MLIKFLMLQMVDTTIPLWTIIICFITAIGTGLWSLISMYFRGIAMNTRITELEKKLEIETIRINEELGEHKEATSKNFEKLYKRMEDMKDLIVETNTYCKILLGDKLPHKK